jgi:methionine-rich copper-binding protein CopC
VRTTRGRLTGSAVAVAVTVSVAGLALAAGAPPARLAAAAPADHDRLRAAPRAVSLTFTERPDLARSHLGVVDGTGRPVAAAPVQASGDNVVSPVAIAGPGAFLGRVPDPAIDPGEPTVHDHGEADPVTATLLVLDAAALIAALLLAVWRRRPRA